MPIPRVKGLAFDMYGTVVDVGAVARACREVAGEQAEAFNMQWRQKQLEYSFLRSLMGKYQNFWSVSQQALDYTIARLGLQVSAEERERLMDAWLNPTPYPEVAAALPRLAERYKLAILSNGAPTMLRVGLERTGLKPHFKYVISAHQARIFKPSPKVYALGPRGMRLKKHEILFVSSNAFDVLGAKSFGYKVCWINRTGAPLDPLGPRADLVVRSFEELAAVLG